MELETPVPSKCFWVKTNFSLAQGRIAVTRLDRRERERERSREFSERETQASRLFLERDSEVF